jgi:hypothetical protein
MRRFPLCAPPMVRSLSRWRLLYWFPGVIATPSSGSFHFSCSFLARVLSLFVRPILRGTPIIMDMSGVQQMPLFQVVDELIQCMEILGRDPIPFRFHEIPVARRRDHQDPVVLVRRQSPFLEELTLEFLHDIAACSSMKIRCSLHNLNGSRVASSALTNWPIFWASDQSRKAWFYAIVRRWQSRLVRLPSVLANAPPPRD